MSTVLRRRVSLERSSAQTSRNSLREGLERCGMPEECVEAVVLSADEAYVNGLVHSEQPQGSVTVSNDVEIGRLLPELRDMGRGREIGSEDQRRTQPDPLSSHGRGLLTQRFMDEVEITDDRAGGTRVRLTKDFLPASLRAVRLHPRATDPPPRGFRSSHRFRRYVFPQFSEWLSRFHYPRGYGRVIRKHPSPLPRIRLSVETYGTESPARRALRDGLL